MTYTVAVFEVDRAYGGPEEGGWWFDYGQPLPRSCRLPFAASWTRFRNRQAAIALKTDGVVMVVIRWGFVC